MIGAVYISTGGSFPTRTRTFSSQHYGHAHAVAQAIEYLSKVVLPDAINQDHQLRNEGSKPTKGFIKEIE